MLSVEQHKEHNALQQYRTDTSLWAWLESAGPVAVTLSFVFHLSILILFTFGLPYLPKNNSIDMESVVAVEFVEIAEITQTNREHSRAENKDDKTRAEVQKPDVKPRVNDTPAKPKPKSAPTVDAQVQPLTIRDNKDSKNAAPPPDDSVPMPEESKPEKVLAPVKPDKPSKRPKPPEPKKDTEAQQQKAFDSVLKNLQISENSSAVEEAGEKAQTAAPKTLNLGDRVTISELDALRSQLAQCWNVLAGANFDKRLIVDIKLYMNPDRTVRKHEIVDGLRYNTDSFFKAAADQAVRGIYSPACTPLNLPTGKYDQWKEITVRFDPSEML
ncbi:MAG: hypothetical protein NZ828_02035 [Alphaproteobacteria bacterium]|nr:hypothetical protein [Alphaproteobacteria bacterium]